MIVIGIDWSYNWVLIISGSRMYNCKMEERDDDFYFRFKNKWHPVSTYAKEDLDAEIKSHKTGMNQKRDSISQAEFESICKEVLSETSDIIEYWFKEPGIVTVVYPSHSRKSRNGATLYFGESGIITYRNWSYSAGSNKGIFIGEKISRKFIVPYMLKANSIKWYCHS